jgi:hypothetical protein
MNDEDAGLATAPKKRGPKTGTSHKRQALYWQGLLGPDLTDELIEQAHEDIREGRFQ